MSRVKYFTSLPIHFFIALLGLLQIQAFAEPNIRTSISASKITHRQTVILQIEASWPKTEANYAFAFPGLQAKRLVLDRQGQSEEVFSENGEEHLRKTFSFEFKPVEPGQGEIAAFVLIYMDPILQVGGKTDIPAHKILIKKDRSLLAYSVAIVFSCLILLYLFLNALRRRGKKENLRNDALKESKSFTLKTQDLLQGANIQNDAEAMNVFVSNFYLFFETVYGVNLTRCSANELDLILNQKHLSKAESDSVKKLIFMIQEAKYSGISPDPSLVKEIQRKIVRFIESKQIVGQP